MALHSPTFRTATINIIYIETLPWPETIDPVPWRNYAVLIGIWVLIDPEM